jgi:hypothetical protein
VVRNQTLKWTVRASALELQLLGRYGLHRQRIIHCATIASSVETLEKDGFAGIISWFSSANPESDPNEIRFVWLSPLKLHLPKPAQQTLSASNSSSLFLISLRFAALTTPP